MQPAFQSVQVIKKTKKNTEWMFSVGVFLNFKAFFSPTHTLLTCSLLTRQGQVGGAACAEARERTNTTGVRHTCSHMTPMRQIRAQTDEALLNGGFY